MKYAVEMDLRAMICIPSLVKIGSSIQKFMGGIHRDTDSYFFFFSFFFKIRKGGL
jgi:hypothetical protein